MKEVFDYLNYEWKEIGCCNQNKKYVECIFSVVFIALRVEVLTHYGRPFTMCTRGLC